MSQNKMRDMDLKVAKFHKDRIKKESFEMYFNIREKLSREAVSLLEKEFVELQLTGIYAELNLSKEDWIEFHKVANSISKDFSNTAVFLRIQKEFNDYLQIASKCGTLEAFKNNPKFQNSQFTEKEIKDFYEDVLGNFLFHVIRYELDNHPNR